ncbi:hypothetical protein PHMEG_00032938 [Phytophthora megakarya]|uniref:Reverse transcriptase n=1 Tax=Phytophthora megakarya TaxID=4795 RepID=A0A225UVW8_9STRA|nr:hypothetical protein PHMEG_00032938 [Phytophthora megakarya]
MVDADVLEFLRLDTAEEDEVNARTEFPCAILDGSCPRVEFIHRRHCAWAPTWDQLCEDLNVLLYRLRYCNISVSLPKSEICKLTVTRSVSKVTKIASPLGTTIPDDPEGDTVLPGKFKLLS